MYPSCSNKLKYFLELYLTQSGNAVFTRRRNQILLIGRLLKYSCKHFSPPFFFVITVDNRAKRNMSYLSHLIQIRGYVINCWKCFIQLLQVLTVTQLHNIIVRSSSSLNSVYLAIKQYGCAMSRDAMLFS